MSPSQATKSAPRRRWTLIVASAVFVPLLIVGGLEFCLRVANVGFPTDLLTPCTVKGQPASCYNLFFAAPFFPPGMIQTPRPYSIPNVKPPKTYRIFVLGESAAMGDPEPAYGFSRYLEVMLRQRYPDTRFEVVNTGSVAINSHVSLQIARELANSKPDLFIVYSGNNEVVGPYGPGTTLASAWGMQLPVIRASMKLHASRIGQLLTKASTPKTEWRGMELFLDKQIRANSPLMNYAYSNFDQNLRDTVLAARRAGARVIISSVATNIRDCAPFGSLHREGLSQKDLSTWKDDYQKGIDLAATGSHAEALKAYQAAEAIDPDYAELQFRMARSLHALGDGQQAAERYGRARDLDSLRFRADSRINEVNRAVGTSVAGAEFVDANAILSSASRDGVIGRDLVYEHVHLTPLGNYLLARAMFLQIATKLPAAAPLNEAAIPSEAECEQYLALTVYDRARIAAEMLRRLTKPPFTNQTNHEEQVSALTLQAQPPEANPYELALLYQWALARNPDDAMLHYRYGLFLYDHGSMASIEQLRLSQPWDGFPVFTPDGRQIQ